MTWPVCTSEVHLDARFSLVLVLRLDFFPAGFLRQAEKEDGSAEEARSENGLFPLISLHGRVWEPHLCADVPLGWPHEEQQHWLSTKVCELYESRKKLSKKKKKKLDQISPALSKGKFFWPVRILPTAPTALLCFPFALGWVAPA